VDGLPLLPVYVVQFYVVNEMNQLKKKEKIHVAEYLVLLLYLL